MQKKHQFSTAILLSMLSASAFSGFYVGGGVGPEMGNFSFDARVLHANDLNVVNKTNVGARGAFVSVFAGYGEKIRGPRPDSQPFYLGGEINVNASSLESTSVNREYVNQAFSNTEYQMSNSFGVSILPGFLFTDATLFFARFGFVRGNFKIYTNDISLAPTNKYLDGIRYGLGIKQTVYKQFSVIMDYSQITYQGVKRSATDISSSVTKNSTFSPTTAQVEFGLIYNFV